MARRVPPRRESARPQSRKLSKLVSSLKAKASSAVRSASQLAKGRRGKSAAAPAQAARPAASKPPLPPLTRTSVVKKPARGPSFKGASSASKPSAKAAAKPAPGKPVQRRSVVRKPPRGPTVQRIVKKLVERRRQPRVSGAPSARPKGIRAGARPRVRTIELASPQPAAPAAALPPMTGGAPTLSRDPEQAFSIPTGYGDDRIVLMVKDPWWIHAYWEIQQGTERHARAQLLPHEAADLKTVLRVYDVTDVDFPSQPAHRSFDIALSGMATSWYIETNAPGRSFIVEIGLLANNGRFILLARSNRVTTPRFGPSDVIDEAWVTTDERFWRLFGAAAGFGIGSSRPGGAEVTPHQLLSSGWSSSGLYGLPKPPTVHGFWARVNTDVVIHGATEPKSTVTVQGQAVPVRKDGTFGLRITLPDGTHSIGVEVTSPDGRRTQTVMPMLAFTSSGTLAPMPPGSPAPTREPSA